MTSPLPSDPWSNYRMGLAFYLGGELPVCFPDLSMMTSSLSLLGFMTYIVEPLFQEWVRFTGNSPLSESMLNHLAHNKAQWKSLMPGQHRNSGSGGGSGSSGHTGPGTEKQEQTVSEGDAP